MTDTPNRSPLWRALKAADASWTSDLTIPEARAIKAVRDWLVPEEKQPPQRKDIGGWNSWHDKLCWDERQRLRALLTTEADRAERGDHG